jgi:YhcH/YjgK/YiaL family protein
MLDDIINFIKITDISKLSEGDIHIKGDDLYVKVLRYIPKYYFDNFFETHNDYIDVQIVFEGIELMQFVSPKHLLETDKFKLEGDFKFYNATENISDFVVSKNEFVVFFPGEPHKPSCLYNEKKEKVLKLVFKVRK